MKALVIHARDRVVELHRRIRGGARSNAPAARTTVLPEAVEFQDGVDEVIKEPFPRFLDSSHYFVVLLFLILVLIAAVIETDVVLTGGGRLITDTPTFVVQTLERGIIRELNIKPGLAVTKGQVLATMDPTFARADLASVAIQQQAAQAQQRRLEAELAGSVFDTAGIAPDESGAESSMWSNEGDEPVAPGLATRRASRKPPLKLRQWWAEKRLATKSNSASGNGSASAEASTVSMLSMPRARADDATAANISVDKSQATTRPVELARA